MVEFIVKSLTIKGMPDKLHTWLKRRAGAHHRSINREVLHILQSMADGGFSDSIDLGGAQLALDGAHHDLDTLAGTWTAEEAAEFEANTAAFRQIDEDMWK